MAAHSEMYEGNTKEKSTTVNIFMRLKEKSDTIQESLQWTGQQLSLYLHRKISFEAGEHETKTELQEAKEISYSERPKLSEGELSSKLEELINCNACAFIIPLLETNPNQAF